MGEIAIAVPLAICAAAAAFEGALAGGGIKQRFAELQLPPFSPPLVLWFAIGIAYYAMCFLLLQRLLAVEFSTSLRPAPFALLVGVMLFNAVWGYVFFRRKSVRVSFLALLPYAGLVLILAALLLQTDRVAAAILAPYVAYLAYATWWADRLSKMNPATVEAASRPTRGCS